MIRLNTHLGTYPGTAALKNRSISSPLIEFEFANIEPPSAGFKRVVRDLEFDVAEVAIMTFLQAIEHGAPLSLLPIVVGPGRFQHQCLVYNTERGPLAPADLRGKRIGTRSYAQTTPAWIRGFLQHDFGIAPDRMRWTTFEDAHVAAYRDPAFVARASVGQQLVPMLVAGELDAIIVGNDAPADPRIKPVFTDHQAAAETWAQQHHAVPINHVIVVKRALAALHPEILSELARLFAASKARTAPATTPFDLLPQGAAALHNALTIAIEYAYEQGLIARRLAVDALLAQ